MKKTGYWTLGFVALALAGMTVGYFAWGNGNDANATNPNGEAPAERAMPVRTIVLEPQALERTLRLTGTLRADESIDLRAEISAKVLELPFREGEEVEEGDLLVKLDDTELQAELQEIEADLVFARREEQRQRQLFEDGSTSESQLDTAENRRSLLEARKTTVQARLAKTEIRAPFSGVVGLREVSPGSLVQPETRVASLQRLEPLKIDFSAPERYAAELRPGLDFEIAVPGSENRYAGTVYAREPGIEADTRTVRLRGKVENPEGHLLPGGYAQVFLQLGVAADSLVVPTVAVVPGRESSVFVLTDDRVERRTVTLGRRTRDRVAIHDGVEAGETIVTAGVQNIQDGQLVRVLEDDGERDGAQ